MEASGEHSACAQCKLARKAARSFKTGDYSITLAENRTYPTRAPIWKDIYW